MSSEYDMPRPSRIHLKETAAEKAQRIYRKEEARQQRTRERIARANGPGPSSSSSERTRRRSDAHSDDGHGHARHAHRQSRAAFVNDMDDMDDMDDSLFGDFSFGSAFRGEGVFGSMPGAFPFSAFTSQRIPSRFRPPPSGPSFGATSGTRLPPMGNMSDDEYASFIRSRFHAAQRAADLNHAARRGAEARAEAERAYRAERVEEERAERDAKRRRRARAEAAAADAARAASLAQADVAASRAEERAAQTEERARWRKRCAALFDAEILAVNLGFSDVPWPVASARGSGFGIVLSPSDLTADNVKRFLYALADDETKGGRDGRRKVIRDAIRLFHSDRFHSRVLPRVREGEREIVKDGVEIVARILTDLLSVQ